MAGAPIYNMDGTINWDAMYGSIGKPDPSAYSYGPAQTSEGLNVNPVTSVPINGQGQPVLPGYSGGINNNKDQTQLQPGFTGVGSGRAQPGSHWLAGAQPRGMDAAWFRANPSSPMPAKAPMPMMPPMPIPRPMTLQEKSMANLNRMPPLQIQVNGGNRAPARAPAYQMNQSPRGMPNIAPVPVTFAGSSTGRPYNVGQNYQAAGYQYRAMPNGTFQNVGQAHAYQGMSPSEQYAAANAPATWQGAGSSNVGLGYDPPGTPSFADAYYPDGTPRS